MRALHTPVQSFVIDAMEFFGPIRSQQARNLDLVHFAAHLKKSELLRAESLSISTPRGVHCLHPWATFPGVCEFLASISARTTFRWWKTRIFECTPPSGVSQADWVGRIHVQLKSRMQIVHDFWFIRVCFVRRAFCLNCCSNNCAALWKWIMTFTHRRAALNVMLMWVCSNSDIA